MTAGKKIEGLLADLQTITDTARAGVISKRDEVLELGETRLAAILFVDIVGFTALARNLASEVLTRVVDRVFRIFELTVRAHGGYCDKVMGDAALYVFAGHPNYPPVCEAALSAALKLHDRLGQINQSLGGSEMRLAIRQGVAFGEVTRQAVGAEQAQLTVIGETVNQAQRLQTAAQPGTIQTTFRVLEKAGDTFTADKLGKLELKGIGAVTTYRVTGVLEQPVQLRGAFRHLSPLVGREAELELAVAQIQAWLRLRYPPETWDITQLSAPLQKRNRLLLLSGVPAVGKSRLAYEIAERAKAELGAVVATAHCSESVLLAQFTAELARVAGLTAANLPQRWETLCANAAQAVSPKYAERQREHVRLLAYALGCKEIDASAIGQADPQSFAVSCQLAIRACCELAAHEGKPVLLIIDDLQWLGGLKDVLADVLARTCMPQPLVIIGTVRSEHALDSSSLAESSTSTIELQALPRQQGDVLLQHLLPGLELPDAIADELHDKAAGIPYFYEDFVRMLVRKRLVARKNARWTLAQQLVELDVPDDLRTLMLGRLDQLDSEVRELARRASVLGRSFLRDLLVAIEQRLGFTHEGHPDDDLRAMLDEKLIVSEPGDRYFFEHALLRETIYGSLLTQNRRLLHRLAAEILSGLHVPGGAGELELLEQLIGHLEGSGQYRMAYEQACVLLQVKAFTMSLGGWDHWFVRAQGLLGLSGAIAQPPLSAALYHAQGEHQYRLGCYEQAAAFAEQALSAARDEGAHLLVPSILHLIGNLEYAQGRLAQARAHYEDAQRRFQEQADQRSEGRLLNSLGLLHRDQGRSMDARRCYEDSLAIARSLEDRRGEAYTLNGLGALLTHQGPLAEARTSIEEALRLTRQLADHRGVANALNSLGRLNLRQGFLREAQGCCSRSLALYREVGNRRGTAYALGNLALLYRYQGSQTEARSCAEDSLAIRQAIGDRQGEGYALYELGCLQVELRDLQQACAMLLAALAIEQDSPYLQCACQVQLGRIYAWQGRLEDAEAALQVCASYLADLQDACLGCLFCGSWVYYELAGAGYLPARLRSAATATAVPEPSVSLQAALGAAKRYYVSATGYALRLGTGLNSELWQDTNAARAAIIDFAHASGLEAEVAELVADHEREQAELALRRAEQQSDTPP